MTRATGVALVFLLVAFPIARIILQLYVPGGGTHLAMRLFTGVLELIIVVLTLADRTIAWPDFKSWPRWATWLPGLWIAWSVPAIALSAIPTLAVVRQVEWLIHGAFGIALWAYLTAHEDWRTRLIQCIVNGFLLYAVVLTYILFQVPDPETYPWTAGILGFANVRHFGHFTTIALIAAYAPFLRVERGKNGLAVPFCILTVIYAYLVWSGGRGPFLGILCTFLVLLSLGQLPNWRRLMLVSSLAFVLGTTISIPFTPPDTSFGAFRFLVRSTTIEDANAFSSGRAELWERSAGIIQQHPLFGIGPDQFRETLGGSPTIFFHPHNGLLQAVLEWGLPGGILFWGMLVAMIVAGYRRLKTQYDPETLIGLGLTLTLLFVSMVSGTLYFAMPLCALSIAFALMFSGHQPAFTVKPNPFHDAAR